MFFVVFTVLFAGESIAQNSLPSAESTDPAVMGWMLGTPPDAAKLVRHDDLSFYQFPRTRWTFSHFRELLPTKRLWRGAGAGVPLVAMPDGAIDGVEFTPMGQSTVMSFGDMLTATYADAALVLHKGDVVYENYFGATSRETPHISFSMTKSYYGTLAAMLVEEGQLEEDKLVRDYLPELADSGFATATVRQILDMTTAIDYSEDYTDPDAHVFDFARSGGIFPRGDYDGPEGFYAYVATLKAKGKHGNAFSYRSVNTEVLGWLIARVTGSNAVDLLQERIWSRLGAEEDAYILIDTLGTGWAAGGLNATLRDHARFGEMMRKGGRWNGAQVVPEVVVDDIRRGGDREKFAKAGYTTLPGASYRNQWWVHHNPNGAFSARGVHGQTIYIDPRAEMVIVRLASHPLAANGNYDDVSLPAYQAVADYLMAQD
ncbi:serine hydrolase domain-containing protein [Congregibacter litoralis]|uniref:Beta-lactamase class C and other penicillin binding protein n=1 Tax=Congregibacter litoralis KT71 TaxID=314285 RepID=A4AE12_9GAMM|nr:serine hydrolase [Congregibacter litoralis]EAQ95760.2 Beta-lactamase class C and other penicillin binding protein [Congregibacter litoralis KT71]